MESLLVGVTLLLCHGCQCSRGKWAFGQVPSHPLLSVGQLEGVEFKRLYNHQNASKNIYDRHNCEITLRSLRMATTPRPFAGSSTPKPWQPWETSTRSWCWRMGVVRGISNLRNEFRSPMQSSTYCKIPLDIILEYCLHFGPYLSM